MNNNEATNEQRKPITISTIHTKDNRHTKYFGISVKRLVFLDFLTLGLYTYYWFYKSWQAVKRQERSNISPFWRSIFHIFFTYCLFKRIEKSVNQYAEESKSLLPAKVFATLYVLSYIISQCLVLIKIPYPLVMSSLAIGLYVTKMTILGRIQQMILVKNAKVIPHYNPIKHFAAAEVILIVFGVFFFFMIMLMLFISMFMKPS
jgi:hypothetical protein